MSNASNRNGVLSCGKGWKVDWRVDSGWSARGSGKTEAAGVREGDVVISWFLSGGEGL